MKRITRYEQLILAIHEIQPRKIVEIGTHRGTRAVEMCHAALQYRADVQYVGYDVFDTETPEFHEAAFNGKGVASFADVSDRLAEVTERHKGFRWHLYTGQTQETLHGKTVEADLVFIDGDHRADVIQGDYEAVKSSRVIFLDDYYEPDDSGRCPDLDVIGCNKLVNCMPNARVLPVPDPIREGGFTKLAVIGY